MTFLTLAHAGRAQEVYVWDADNGSSGAQDGTGTWTAGQPNWLNQTLGLDNQSWVNGSHAIIGAGDGAAGTITLGGPVTVGNLTFNAPGSDAYTLGGSQVLTLQNSLVTVNAAATINTPLAGDTAWEKSGAAQLTLGGSLSNTHTGALTVSQGRLHLAKTGGATAIAGDLSITSGAHVTFTASTTNQIAPAAHVTMSGAASAFNGTGPNTTSVAVNQTLASLTVTGGAFSSGFNSVWNIDEVSFLAGENRTFVGNSASVQTYGSLTLAGMNGASSSTAVANGFTLFGNNNGTRTSLTIGAGGLSLENSRLHLKRGSGAGTLGSRVVLNGDVSVTGGTSRFEQASSGTEVNGLTLLELSGTAGDVARTFTVDNGATLDIQVDITNGAAANASLVKEGAGNLILGSTGVSSHTGMTILNAGTLTLSRTGGGVALAADVQVNSGGVLAMTQPDQFGPDAGIVINGGTVSAISTTQTFAHFTQLSGGLVTSGNTGQVTITGALTLAGGGQLTINSFASATPASWVVESAVLTGANLLIGGSNGTGNPRTSLTIGAGGLRMEGRTITLNRGNAGVVMNLFGGFTGTGNNNITLGGSGSVTPLLDLGAVERVFDVVSGTTTLGVEVTGAGGILKQGTGLLQLTQASSLTGALTSTGGVLALSGTSGAAATVSGVSAHSGGHFQNGSSSTGNNNDVSDRINPAASLTLGSAQGGGSFQLMTATSGAHTQSLEALILGGGSNTLTVLANTGTTATLTLTGASPYVRGAGSVNFIQNPGDGGSIVLTNAPSGAGNVSGGVLTGATLNGTDLVAAQSGVLTAFSGWIPTGTDTWTAGASMDVTGSNPVAYPAAAVNALRFNTAGAFTVTLDGAHSISSDVLLVTPNVGENVSRITGGTLSGSAGGQLVVSQFNTAGILEIASQLVDNGGATGLTKNGPGVLHVTGGSAYTGLTRIEEGVLRAADGTGLPAGSALLLNGGAFESTTGAFTRSLGDAAGQVSLAAGASGFSAFSAPLTVNLGGAAAVVTWGSAFFNPSALVLNAASADSALDFLNPLDLNGGARVIQVDAQTATLTGGLTDSAGGAQLDKTGAGILLLPAANTFSGTIAISGGTLALGHDGALGTGVIALNGGALTADNDARTLENSVNLTANSFITGSQSITLNGDFTNTSGNRSLTVSLASPAVFEMAGHVYLSESATASRSLNILGSSTRVISGVIANNAGDNSLASHLFFNGGGTLTLTAENTFTGRTLAAGGGYIVISQDRNLGAVPAAPSTDAVILANNGRLRAASTFTLDAGRHFGIGNSGGGAATGQIDVTSGNVLTVAGIVADRTLNVDGTPTPANTGGLTKTGTGVLVLTGDNTFSGVTTVSNGILRVGSNTALGSTAGGTSVSSGRHVELMDGVVITGETLTLNGGNGTTGPGTPDSNRGGLQASAGATAEWAGPVVIGVTSSRIGVQEGGTLTVSGDITDGGAGHTVVFSGDLSGAGALILSGSGNDWGGSTNIVRGTVKLGAHDSLPAGTTLDIHFASSNNSEYAGLDLNGFNQTVARLINSGVTGANANLTNSSRALSTFTVNQSVTATYNGVITGNLALVKSGPAVMVLSQANSFTGGVTIEEGVIRLTNGAALAEGNVTLLGGAAAGGTLDLNNVSTAVINALSGGAGDVPGLIVNDSTTAGTRTLTVGVNHATSTYSGNILNNNGGAAQGMVGLAKIGAGTLTLSGQNTHTGSTAVRHGTLVADFNDNHPLGGSTIRLEGGTLVIANASAATIGAVTLVQSGADFTTARLRIENGATITTPVFTGSSFAPFVLDVRGGGTFIAESLATSVLSSDVLVQGGSNRATLYVHDDAGFGFATRNGSNEIVRYTGATALTESNSSNTTNFILTGDLTRTAALAYHTLQIDASSAPVTLTMGANNLTVGSNARSVLFTGAHDATITATTGAFSGGSVFIANHGEGTATLDMSLAGQATIITGPGLVVYTRTNNPADLYVTEGTFRMSGADRNYNSGILRIYGGGILEIGADLNSATDGDFTRAVAQTAGQVALIGSGGFSAHGADRVVALGGVGTAEELAWGANNFLSGPGGDNNYVFKLGSASSTHTLEFQNNIALGARQRVIEVGDGTSSANVDARLTSVLSGAGGGLWKTGAGRLELAGSNTYTGPTQVSAGSLLVTGGTGAGALTVASGAALLGTGVIGGHTVTLENGAALHAGGGTADADFGTLSFHSTSAALFEFKTGSVINLGLSLASNEAALDPSFGGNAIGSAGYYDYLATISGAGAHDQLSFDGEAGSELVFESTLHVVDGGLTPLPGQIFHLLDWSALVSADFSGFDTGTNYRDGSGDDLAQFNLPDLSSHGFVWDVSAFTTSGVIVVVPEPGRALLLLGGLALVMLRRRRGV